MSGGRGTRGRATLRKEPRIRCRSTLPTPAYVSGRCDGLAPRLAARPGPRLRFRELALGEGGTAMTSADISGFWASCIVEVAGRTIIPVAFVRTFTTSGMDSNNGRSLLWQHFAMSA